jgi:hypothetical protein
VQALGLRQTGWGLATLPDLFLRLHAQRVSLPVRMEAGVLGCPGVTVVSQRRPADRARSGHGLFVPN